MKIIKSGIDAKTAIKNGIDKAASLAKATLGPSGHTVIIEKQWGMPELTDDGVTVLKEIEFEDKFEQLGAQLLCEVASKTNDKAGDGTTTATVLAQAIINNVFDDLNLFGNKANDIKSGIQKGVAAALEELKKTVMPVSDEADIERVAFISSLDMDVARIITEIIMEVGKDGVITVEEGQTLGLEKDVVKGMQFDRGFISPYMVTEENKAVAENPYILLSNVKMQTQADLLPVLQKVAEDGKRELVIIGELSNEVLDICVVHKLRGTFNVIAINPPGFAERRKDLLADIAAVIDAKVVDGVTWKFSTVDLTELGEARKVLVTKEDTIIVDGKGDATPRMTQLKDELKATTSEYEKEKLNERIAKLAGGVGVVKVGAATEVEMKARKFKIEDALNATKAAVEEGAVFGGGLALANLEFEVEGNQAEMLGVNAVKKALSAPLNQIAENMGLKPQVLAAQIKASGTVLDPFKVVRSALEAAASLASILVSMDSIIAIKPEPKKDPEHVANL